MKSSIKVDITLNGKAVININAFDTWEDLRDKALNMFLNDTGWRTGGRLCFIDYAGSKMSGSSGDSNSAINFTITPISIDHYEILQKELEDLIKERNESCGYYTSDGHKKIIAEILADANKYNTVMNY